MNLQDNDDRESSKTTASTQQGHQNNRRSRNREIQRDENTLLYTARVRCVCDFLLNKNQMSVNA